MLLTMECPPATGAIGWRGLYRTWPNKAYPTLIRWPSGGRQTSAGLPLAIVHVQGWGHYDCVNA